MLTCLRPLDHAPTATCVLAERAILQTLGGDCQVPVAAHARLMDRLITIDGLVGRVDGTEVLRGRIQDQDPHAAGSALAEALLRAGAGRILQDLRADAPGR